MEKLIVAVMLYLTDQQCNKEAVAVAFLKPSSGRGKRTVHSIHNNVADYHGKVKESYSTIIRGHYDGTDTNEYQNRQQ